MGIDGATEGRPVRFGVRESTQAAWRKIWHPVSPRITFLLSVDALVHRSSFTVHAFSVILLKNVKKAFGPKRVLDGFTLEIPDGETMVIIGYSGTGKSVALKHIVGLLEPDEGEVWVDGLNVPELPRRELYELRSKIGYVFQFAALFDSFTIGENVAMGLRKQGELTDSEISRRVDEALDLVDLPGVRDRFPAELSGGMRKRVGIARAIALRPKYMLYDEPTTGLDPVTSAVIDQLMVRMSCVTTTPVTCSFSRMRTMS
jgi:phospholipid/cholesterol/gamma-HCH transport system ATP-binding protein